MRAIVFDLDGTLVDSAPDLHAAAARMLAERALAPQTVQQITSFVGNGVPKLVERCLDAAGFTADADARAAALASFHGFYSAEPIQRTRPYDGVEAMLTALQGEGYALGICTNKPAPNAKQVLEGLGLAERFGSVVGGGTLAVLKPDAAPLLHCIAELGAPVEQALFVGDSEADEATAIAAGVPFALYSGGYRKKSVEGFEAGFVFDHFDALAPYIRGLGA